MDGYEATKQIKARIAGDRSKMDTKIIALTASSFEREQAIHQAVPYDDFLRKPIREVDFFELMVKHIGVRYIYAEMERPEKLEIKNLQAELTALPPELLTKLEQAALDIDIEMINELLSEIHSHNSALARQLRALANEFRYDEIASLIQVRNEK